MSHLRTAMLNCYRLADSAAQAAESASRTTAGLAKSAVGAAVDAAGLAGAAAGAGASVARAVSGELIAGAAGAVSQVGAAVVAEAQARAKDAADQVREHGTATAADVADLGPRRQRRRVWADGGHAAIEMRGISGSAKRRQRLASAARSRLRKMKGVRWAEVNAITAQVLIAFDERSVDVGELTDTIRSVEKAQGASEEDFSWSLPEHPSDDTPVAATYAALAADLVGVTAGIVGRVGRIPPLHPLVRVPLTVVESYPRLRRVLEKRIGPMGADVLLAAGNAVVYGISDGPARPALDACYRLFLVGELQARSGVWKDRAVDLCFGAKDVSAETAGRWPKRPAPLPPGPVEAYADRAAAGTLLASMGVLAATRSPGRSADALLAGVPTAARFGREGFAAVLGRDLARRGVIPADRRALRRLDRVSAVLVDSRVLCAARPRVLSATARSSRDGTPGDDAAVWRAAGGVLRQRSLGNLSGPGPWANGRHRLVRDPAKNDPAKNGTGAAPDSPEGMRLAVMTARGRRLGHVTIGCELDPLAEAVLSAARAGGARLLLTRHASTQDLIARVDEVAGGELTACVRELQSAGEGVMLLSEDPTALAAADVSVGCLREGSQVCWTADLICGPGLADAWRLLQATARARPVSERGVTLAMSGSALGILLAAVGPGRRQTDLAASPSQAAAFVSLISGAYTARAATRMDPPRPALRTAWHAMEGADVLARLESARDQAAGPQAPPSDDSGTARTEAWQDGSAPAWLGGLGGIPAVRWLGGLGGSQAGHWLATVIASPPEALLVPVRGTGQLVSAVATELKDPLTPVLLVGAAASAVLGSGVDSALVGGVMLGNALVGAAQRFRTERALRDLLLREQQSGRRVRRAPGDPIPDQPSDPGLPTHLVPASELNPGDVIALRPDDVVPADARLLVADALEVDESTLTGESMPVSKDAAPVVAPTLDERTSMVYEGTTVLAGSALAVVVAVGEATEAGRAGAAAGGAKPPAGVQARLGDLTRIALPATGLGGLTVTGLGLLRRTPLREAVAAGVAVAVAAVPEGLPLVATVAQLSAARRLSACGVLVRSARTLEALGRVDVLCFDKTGTLTQGRLEVTGAAGLGGDLDLSDEHGKRLLTVAARACPVPGQQRVTHATDQAILTAAGFGEDGDKNWELLDELPFQNGRGYSASLGRQRGQVLLAAKGAPEVLLAGCSHVITASQDKPVSLTAARRRAARSLVERLAADGLRVLAVAEGVGSGAVGDGAHAGNGAPIADLVRDLTLIGFVAIADVMRPDAAAIVADLGKAGVRAVMVTGDHPATASAIARKAGIRDASEVVTGAELDQLAEGERRRRVNRTSVFARVSPEQKVRIIADLRRDGHVVAMTGDGTNDAAAIRLADVGIGVAARGSTAARSASDLVLPGSDIGRIADALREGRALWRSVREAVSMLVGGNAGEIAFMVLGTAAAGRSPLNTRQLLLVNMLTDMFPALAVALGAAAQGQSLDDEAVAPMMGAPLTRAIAVRGGATALGATLAWAGGRITGRGRRASSMGLAALVATQLGQTLAANSKSPVVITTCAVSAAALVVMVNTPGVSQFFGCTPLGPLAWGIVTGSCIAGTAAGILAPRFLPVLDQYG